MDVVHDGLELECPRSRLDTGKLVALECVVHSLSHCHCHCHNGLHCPDMPLDCNREEEAGGRPEY
jgi:hypothetical protein